MMQEERCVPKVSSWFIVIQLIVNFLNIDYLMWLRFTWVWENFILHHTIFNLHINLSFNWVSPTSNYQNIMILSIYFLAQVYTKTKTYRTKINMDLPTQTKYIYDIFFQTLSILLSEIQICIRRNEKKIIYNKKTKAWSIIKVLHPWVLQVYYALISIRLYKKFVSIINPYIKSNPTLVFDIRLINWQLIKFVLSSNKD